MTVKETKKLTNSQLTAWLLKTERSGMNLLYSGKLATDRMTELRMRWEDIAREMGRRNLTNEGRRPTHDGDGPNEYNFGDAIC
jgi:hypothetical protein